MKVSSVLARVMLASVLLFAVAGCAKDATTGEASDTASSAEGASSSDSAAASGAVTGADGWMDGIPDSVPVFSYGTFDTEESSTFQAGPQTLYNLYYDGVDKADAEAYLGELEAAGITVVRATESDGLSAAGELMDGETKVLGLSFSWQADGHVDYTITVLSAS